MRHILTCLVALGISSCTEKIPQNPAEPAPSTQRQVPPEVPAPIRGQDYRLVFSEDFDGPSGSTAAQERWSPWALGTRKGAFNVADSCRLDGQGHLLINVRRNEGRIETGGLTTRGKFEATHGYFECRCKPHAASGAWSAFWIQSPSIGKPLGDAAKAGVEIDVLECFPGHKRYKRDARHTAHWDGYGSAHKQESVGKLVPDITEAFHTYAVKWDDSGYVFYIDGVESGRWKNVPVSKRPQYLIISCEAEKWAGKIEEALLPSDFIVDYVRVWQTPAQAAADKR
ncbi:MAG: hypothetical protein RL095_3485 [Verrucomicrobiota bacterium]|jgi:hypothetical protein